MSSKGIRVISCPIGLEYCYQSCRFRRGTCCYFASERGREIPELKKEKDSHHLEWKDTRDKSWIPCPASSTISLQ
ncbi:MAG TPA: hypothetical protein G4O01_04090 [Dehalococcoidia bacterium]|jgi:hypothetical protein|nr:hypothetical protein [Dehalococcoidia bacterium]